MAGRERIFDTEKTEQLHQRSHDQNSQREVNADHNEDQEQGGYPIAAPSEIHRAKGNSPPRNGGKGSFARIALVKKREQKQDAEKQGAERHRLWKERRLPLNEIIDAS